jgi:PAS domain S-box-containing protein
MAEGHAAGSTAERDALFRLLVESVRDYAIFALDPRGIVTTWNAGAERLKGYPAAEIVGRGFERFYTAEDRARGRPGHLLRAAAAEGSVEDEGWRVRKDGSRFWASVVITALRDATGALVGFGKVTRDLTERKRADEERVQLLVLEQAARVRAEAAEATLEARNQFLSVAAHELKTPLTSLRAAAQLLLRRLDLGAGPDPQSLRRGLRVVDEQLERLARLVDQLLDVVGLEAGRLVPARARTDLAALVARAVELAQARAGGHALRVTAPGPVWADVDPGRLEQVLANLLDNAIKYSPGGGPIDVELTEPGPGTVRLAVRDRGLGIPPEHRARLFERFYQAHAGNHRSGLGLGLHLSREIVEQHGGEIRAEFPPDGGTRFVVTLPAAPAEAGPRPTAPRG